MRKIYIPIGLLVMTLLAVFVVATAPSSPTLSAPANNTLYINDFNFECTLPSNAQWLQYKVNESVFLNTSSTSTSSSFLGIGNYNWSCRACNSTLGSEFIDFVPKEDLITYLSLDDSNTTGVVTRDLTLQGRNGTINPSITTGIEGKKEQAFDSSDTNGAVHILDDTQTRLLNGGTINMWVNLSALANGDRFFSKTDGTGQGTGGYACFWGGGGSTVECYVNNQIAVTSNAISGDGTYSMLTVVIADDPSTFKIYVNGTDFTNTVTARNIVDSTGYNLTIANRGTTFDRALSTPFDEIAVWNITLNQENITGLWNNSIGLFYPQTNATTNTTECSVYPELRNLIISNFTEAQGGNALRLIFKNESDSNTIFGNLQNLELELDTNDTTSIHYDFTNTTSMDNWTFNVSPSTSSIGVEGNVTYLSSGFPQRSTSIDELINGTGITNVTLWLLPSENGLYVTFQILDTGNSPINDVYVRVQKEIDGNLQYLTAGYSDNAGSITFWLDPNEEHRFTFSKTGYTTEVQDITPTQSTYTIIMGSGASINETNYNLGISYNISPTTPTLNFNTVYDFSFNISSYYGNLTSYGFDLVNSSGDLLASQSGVTSTGESLSTSYNTTTNSKISMYYYWDIDGNIVNNTYNWNIYNTTQGSASLKTFFDDLKNFNSGGVDDFSKTLMYLFIMIVITATLIFFIGDTTNSEYSIMGVVVAMLWIGEWANLLPQIGGYPYLISIIASIIYIGYIIQDNVR